MLPIQVDAIKTSFPRVIVDNTRYHISAKDVGYSALGGWYSWTAPVHCTAQISGLDRFHILLA
jgi:hypothetical protein